MHPPPTRSTGPLLLSAHSAAAPPAGEEALCASHSVAIALDGGSGESDAPAWIHLLPAGSFRGVDGRGPYHAPAAELAAIIDRTREWCGGHDLPIDYGHALEQEGAAGDAAPAAGWIRVSEAEVRADGLWAPVDWTPEGGRRVGCKEFRHLSPVFMHDKTGRVLFLLRAGLTNRPNLLRDLAAIHATKETDVSQTLKERLAAALGLSATAPDDELLARCTALRANEGGLARVAQAAQLAATASADEIVTAVNRAGEIDPRKWVARDQYDQVSLALAASQKKDGEREVDAAIEAGKLTPAQREWALAYHGRDAAGFAAFVAAQPVIVPGGRERSGEPNTAGAKLTDLEKKVCSQLGVSEEDFVKTKSATYTAAEG